MRAVWMRTVWMRSLWWVIRVIRVIRAEEG